MNKQTEALKMAIEVLCLVEEYDDNGVNVAKKAIQACKEALEPQIELADTISVEDYQKLREQPIKEEILGKVFDAVYSQYPKKEWQGISDVELSLLAEEYTGADGLDVVDYGYAIEAKLKEMNT